MVEFPHIYDFGKALARAKRRGITGTITYRGTVKLHGTNSGVSQEVEGGPLVPQSRNRELSIENDNYGFAAFVAGADQQTAFADLFEFLRESLSIPRDQKVTVFGEWCGPGVQKNVALAQMNRKQFVFYAVESGGVFYDIWRLTCRRYPEFAIYPITLVFAYHFPLNVWDPVSVAEAKQYVEEVTAQVDERCPWADFFGFVGPGEGIVWTPVDAHWGDSDLWFKSKGSSHKGKRGEKVKVSADPEKVSNAVAFAESAVTEDRLQQGIEYLNEMGLPVDKSSTGAFLAWVSKDVLRERGDTLEASGLDWKAVCHPVTQKACEWYFEQVG